MESLPITTKKKTTSLHHKKLNMVGNEVFTGVSLFASSSSKFRKPGSESTFNIGEDGGTISSISTYPSPDRVHPKHSSLRRPGLQAMEAIETKKDGSTNEDEKVMELQVSRLPNDFALLTTGEMSTRNSESMKPNASSLPVSEAPNNTCRGFTMKDESRNNFPYYPVTSTKPFFNSRSAQQRSTNSCAGDSKTSFIVEVPASYTGDESFISSLGGLYESDYDDEYYFNENYIKRSNQCKKKKKKKEDNLIDDEEYCDQDYPKEIPFMSLLLLACTKPSTDTSSTKQARKPNGPSSPPRKQKDDSNNHNPANRSKNSTGDDDSGCWEHKEEQASLDDYGEETLGDSKSPIKMRIPSSGQVSEAISHYLEQAQSTMTELSIALQDSVQTIAGKTKQTQATSKKGLNNNEPKPAIDVHHYQFRRKLHNRGQGSSKTNDVGQTILFEDYEAKLVCVPSNRDAGPLDSGNQYEEEEHKEQCDKNNVNKASLDATDDLQIDNDGVVFYSKSLFEV